MSYQEIEGLSKADLKNKLSQMGMSLDRNDHPRDYYVQLYIEKSNAKNKITRDNTPFYNNQMLNSKREREKGKGKETKKELMEDPNYEEEEYEEEEEIIDDDDDGNYVNEESEEKEEKVEKGKFSSRRKSAKKQKIDEKTNDYRESGIKITRLIRKKKERIPKNKGILKEQDNVKRRILNNYNEMAGQNDEYENINTDIINIGQNSTNINMNIDQESNIKNNEFYNYQNNNLPNKNNEVITLKVQKYTDNTNTNNNNSNLNIKDNLRAPNQNAQSETQKNTIVSFGAPKNTEQTYMLNIPNGPVKFGVSQNSANSNKDLSQNMAENNSDKSKQYDFFIKNITEDIKDDAKDKQNSFHSKKVVLKWDTPKQKEFLCSSMQKEQTFRRPMEEEEENSNTNKINLQNKFDDKDEKAQEKGHKNIPKNQIVSDSIQNTIIYENENANKNQNEFNDYKTKLRNYKPIINQLDKISKNENTSNQEENEEDDGIEYNDSDFQNNQNNNCNMNNTQDYLKFSNNMSNYNNMDNNKNINANMGQSNLNNYKIMNNSLKNDSQIYIQDKIIDVGESNNDNMKMYTNTDNNMNLSKNYNISNNENSDNIQNPFSNKDNAMVENIIKYNNNNNVINNNENNEQSTGNLINEQNMNSNIIMDNPKVYVSNKDLYNDINQSGESIQSNKKTKSNLKNSIMNKFKNNVYIWPLILLILFGIIFLINYRIERVEPSNIFIIFTIIMALLVLYNLYKYRKIFKEYKKMAKEDRDKLIEYINTLNIKREEIGNNIILINKFIKSRIIHHNITPKEYMNYVFPYLSKFLKKDKYDMQKEKRNNEENIVIYWKEI